MRLAPFRHVLRKPWLPAAAAALTLVGCGSSDEPKGKAAATSTAAAKPPAAATAPATSPVAKAAAAPAPPGEVVDLTAKVITPLVSPLDGPREYEEASEKPLVTSFPEAKNPDAKPAVENLPADDVLLGKPLVINGKVVPFEEVKRQVCLGRIGVTEIESAKLDVYIEQERQRRLNSGASKEDVAVAEQELAEFTAELEDEIKREYPGGDVTVASLFSPLTNDPPAERLRAQKLFQKLFLPDNPADYPPTTLEAILRAPGGDVWLEELKSSYQARAATETPGKKNRELREQDDALLMTIIDHLQSSAMIEPMTESGLLYRVNGVDIRIDDIWGRIKPMITTMEVHAAKQWIVNTTLLEEALKAAGAWLTEEEAEAAYAAHSDPYKDSIFSYERIAISLKQFPSVDRYRHYRRIYDSFYRMMKPQMTEDALKKQGEYRTDKLIGQVTVDADVILCSAFDFKAGRWKPDGWIEAENRMKDVLQLLVEEQRPWEEMVEKYSDFYQPPIPTSAPAELEGGAVKGRFREYQRNNMQGELGESEYGLFLNGSSITDFIFYEQEVGTLGQPMRGPYGWYLPRLIRRSKPPRQLTAKPETVSALRIDDYVVTNLNKYVQDLIAKSEVYGLELPGTVPK